MRDYNRTNLTKNRLLEKLGGPEAFQSFMDKFNQESQIQITQVYQF